MKHQWTWAKRSAKSERWRKKPMQWLESEWHDFRKGVIPQNAPEVQLIEMQCAFFAGAWSIYALMMKISESREVRPEDLDCLNSVHNEMVEFKERLLRGEE